MYLVIERSSWGYYSINIVRAETAEQARKLAVPSACDSHRIEVTELPTDGPPGIVWCYDYSPDTPRTGDD